MPGDDDQLQTLMRIHSILCDDAEFPLDKKVLENLISNSLKFQDWKGKPRPKTGRRAAIAAQKARKKDAQT
jgi:hypothetical protein